jgi:hypothetical protein
MRKCCTWGSIDDVYTLLCRARHTINLVVVLVGKLTVVIHGSPTDLCLCHVPVPTRIFFGADGTTDW